MWFRKKKMVSVHAPDELITCDECKHEVRAVHMQLVKTLHQVKYESYGGGYVSTHSTSLRRFCPQHYKPYDTVYRNVDGTLTYSLSVFGVVFVDEKGRPAKASALTDLLKDTNRANYLRTGL